VACFIAYALDKAAAVERRQRISERSLLLLGLFCGWPGALLAQQMLRHKSAKTSFQLKFWLSVVLNVLLVLTAISQMDTSQANLPSSSATTAPAA